MYKNSLCYLMKKKMKRNTLRVFLNQKCLFIIYFFVIFFHIYDTKFSLKDDIDISSFITFVKTIRNK